MAMLAENKYLPNLFKQPLLDFHSAPQRGGIVFMPNSCMFDCLRHHIKFYVDSYIKLTIFILCNVNMFKDNEDENAEQATS